ncbi:nucleoside-diphosphate kinase [Candidatus Dojkabacteria bacterium]|nr:nucleoside-diphosphate kinase [Candidatus Dojkabacteria bacterium]
MNKTKERTLIIIKHDGVARGLMGEIISRFERVGLKMVALEFIAATDDMSTKHYPDNKEWKEKVGGRTLAEYEEKGIDAKKVLGTDVPEEIGELVKGWLVEYLSMGPVLAMVFEGPEAVRIGRKLVGETNPVNAAPGSIRGDYSWDNADLANEQLRPFYNLIHASGSVEEAKDEIDLWFSDTELMDYPVNVHKSMGYYGKPKM